jgi:hypothetical protein
LRREKRDAIDNMDFDRSSAIQSILDSLDGDHGSAIIAKYRSWLCDGIGEALSMLDAHLESLRREMFDQELQYRRDIGGLVAATRERQIDEMTALAVSKRVALLKEDRRAASQVRVLLRAAKIFAASDEVGSANALKSAAQVADKDGLQGRIDAIVARYDKLEQQQRTRHLNEWDVLQMEFGARIADIDRMTQQRTDAEHKKTTVYIQDQLRRAIAEATGLITKPNQRIRIAGELSDGVASHLIAKQKEFLLK